MKTDNSSGIDPRKFWLIAFLVATVMGLMNFGIIMTNEMAYGKAIPIKYPLLDEMTGSYGVLLLLPLLLWFFRKYPLQRNRLLTRIPLYIGASMIFGGTHTAFMWLSRKFIYWLADMGDYNYGQAIYRLLMEYHKQVLGFWSIFGAVYLIGYVRRNQEQKLRTARLEQELTKARLQALQMQLNPHFLFNTLNMISATMYENVAAADQMIAYLSDLLRLTLKSSSAEEHTLEKELEVLLLYIEIMKARYQEKLQVRLDIDPATNRALVPGFILQPLVENSIKYGMEHLQTTEITVSARQEDQLLILRVKDNGPGMTGEPNQALAQGVGLANTAERLEKRYGTQGNLHLENLPGGGFQVVVSIPFRRAEDTNESENRERQR